MAAMLNMELEVAWGASSKLAALDSVLVPHATCSQRSSNLAKNLVGAELP